MTEYQIRLNNLIQRMAAIGAWKTVEILNQMLLEIK